MRHAGARRARRPLLSLRLQGGRGQHADTSVINFSPTLSVFFFHFALGSIAPLLLFGYRVAAPSHPDGSRFSMM